MDFLPISYLSELTILLFHDMELSNQDILVTLVFGKLTLHLVMEFLDILIVLSQSLPHFDPKLSILILTP